MSELAKELQVDQSTATRLVEALVRIGLVSRIEDPSNRRRKIVSITDRGRETYEQIATTRRLAMFETLRYMEPDRRILFTELFEEFVGVLRRLDDAVDGSE